MGSVWPGCGLLTNNWHISSFQWQCSRFEHFCSRVVINSRGPGPPATLLENRRKIEPKEIPSRLIPRLLVVFTRQLEILVTTLLRSLGWKWKFMRDHCKLSLSFPATCTSVSFRMLFLWDFSWLPQMESLLQGRHSLASHSWPINWAHKTTIKKKSPLLQDRTGHIHTTTIIILLSLVISFLVLQRCIL